MFDWDKLKIKEPRSAEELYAAARELEEKRKKESIPKTNDKDNQK